MKKKLKFSSYELTEWWAAKSHKIGYLMQILEGSISLNAVIAEVEQFHQERQETRERNIKIENNRDYAIQENRISDDPEIYPHGHPMKEGY